jgi:thiol-disulfide isomerase/thioredoxin
MRDPRVFSAIACVVAMASCRERPVERSQRPAGTAAHAGSAVPRAEPVASANSSGGPLTAAPAGLIPVTGPGLLARVRESGRAAVIVNAWASWCGPCRRELPMLVALKANLEPRGIGVELVSVDEPSSHEQAIAFLVEHGVELPSYVAERPLGSFKAALNPDWPGMLPASFLYDKTGKLRYFWGGPVYEEELVKVVDEFLAGTLMDGAARFGLAPGKVER